MIDRGAPRDSPFPIFLAQARSDCHPRSEAKNHDRACVPRWSWSMTLIGIRFRPVDTCTTENKKQRLTPRSPLRLTPRSLPNKG